jgi:hypothetical protein
VVLATLLVPSHSQEPAKPALYLHLLTPTYFWTPPTPPKRVVTTRVHLSEEIEVTTDKSYLAGKIERRGQKYFGKLGGSAGSQTQNRFEGELPLEKIVSSQGGGFGSMILSARFVLSTNSDSKPFLDELTAQGEAQAAAAAARK